MRLYAYFMCQRFPLVAANDSIYRANSRGITVPIPSTITAVPGYPTTLVVFKIKASRFWQIRFWHKGRMHKKSARTLSIRLAQTRAKRLYEHYLVNNDRSPEIVNSTESTHSDTRKVASEPSFAMLASQVMRSEHARTERGDFSRDSLRVMQNRLDTQLLPRWGRLPVSLINYQRLQQFCDEMSSTLSSTSLSQYLVIIRKVLSHALGLNLISKLPEFPKIKIITTPRGAFTPTEYVQLIRGARRMTGMHYTSVCEVKQRCALIREADQLLPADLAWVIGFMVYGFIRPSDLKTLKHRHIEVVRKQQVYLRLTLPETKRHHEPIVTLQPAVRIYERLRQHHGSRGMAGSNDYLFLPHLKDRNYARFVLSQYFGWLMDMTDTRIGPHGQRRSLYSLRHSSITFRLLYGQGIDLLTLARNARTSVDVLSRHYASTVNAEQNIALLHSRRRLS